MPITGSEEVLSQSTTHSFKWQLDKPAIMDSKVYNRQKPTPEGREFQGLEVPATEAIYDPQI